MLTTTLAVIASLYQVAALPSPYSIGQTVQTTSGPVLGHSASGRTEVSEYLGIPYAQPPVGDLRWAPPQPFRGDAIINGTDFGFSCPAKTGITANSTANTPPDLSITPQGAELIVSLLGQVNDRFSEDCLTLNVWTKPQSGEAKKAVMVWIYGGGYSTGATDITAYNGKYIADESDVVIVSINYRLNIFGFPGNPTTPNNLGLLDQRLAVEWIHDNIASFGGDPERITLFGQSAGGSSVDYYSYAWTEDPIVAGFIAESGTVFSPNTQASPATSATSWYNVSGNLGCGDASSDPGTVLNCMRLQDWEDIQNAIPNSVGLSSANNSFGPTIDEVVIFSDYLQRSASGRFARLPMLIGSANNEIGLFRPLFGLQGVTYTDAEWSFLNFDIFTCPISYRALASAVHKSPIWRYRWFGDFPNLRITQDPDSGAWHGSEIPIVFGTDLDIQDKVARTPAESLISTFMREVWTSFAKDPVNGLTIYGLPGYDLNRNTLLRFAYNNQTGGNLAYPIEYDFGCPVATLLTDLLLS